MTRKFFHTFVCIVLSFVCLSAFSCTREEPVKDIDVRFEVPSSVEIDREGGNVSFRIMFGLAPESSDEVLLKGSTGSSYVCRISGISGNRFTIGLPAGMVSGSYDVFVRRGGQEKLMGTMSIIVFSDIKITPDKGTTVYGAVTCDSKGIGGVVVSDGVETTRTDENGVYQLKSAKKYGYVFISVPSGYSVMSEGVLPKMWQSLGSDAQSAERKDFELVETPGDDFTMYILGDMHLGNRSNTKDIQQFGTFTRDLSSTMDAIPGNEYVLTLGDMGWDCFWYSNKFGLPEYLDLVNSGFSDTGIQFFHTMGNHDNDFALAGDFGKEQTYRDVLCPTFYSYNIGKVHFVVIDDIDYMTTVADSYDNKGSMITDHRGEYDNQIVNEQIEWLKKDLSYIHKTTPIVLSTHAPVYRPLASSLTGQYNSGAYRVGLTSSISTSSGTEELAEVLKGYKVHIFTGHTHKTFCYDDSDVSGIFEHNGGSVCGDWWWCSSLTSGINLAPDGAPGGYTVMSVKGTDFEWYYKSTGYPKEYQFRAYDMNEVRKVITADAMKSTKGYGDKKAVADGFVTEMNRYADNEVLLNVWNYDPEWEISVTENGKQLDVTRIWGNDPLHICAKTMKRIDVIGYSEPYNHFFKVKASDASSTLEIRVTDRFGNVYTETMSRPKAMKVDSYKASNFKSITN